MVYDPTGYLDYVPLSIVPGESGGNRCVKLCRMTAVFNLRFRSGATISLKFDVACCACFVATLMKHAMFQQREHMFGKIRRMTAFRPASSESVLNVQNMWRSETPIC